MQISRGAYELNQGFGVIDDAVLSKREQYELHLGFGERSTARGGLIVEIDDAILSKQELNLEYGK